MEPVRVRFPPSPTGYLHIGGARTALFNWAFARKHGGAFVLRIEDTDVERSTEESIREILEGLEWMGIDWDEGPYYQSDHAAEHRRVAMDLVASGHAYPCFCSRERLVAKREEARRGHGSYRYDGACRSIPQSIASERVRLGEPHVIRFRVPRDGGSVAYDDAVFGREERAHEDIEDFVILRSNGLPTYILSNMVDDHRDRISHVIRGQDHRANTHKQVLIYRAMGWEIPRFAHISLTLDSKRRKISKRTHGEVATVRYYRERGFLPWGFCNFIALLGWSPGKDREIFTREEMIDLFSLERLSRVNSVFNFDPEDPRFFTDPKAISINAHHLRNMDLDELLPYVREELMETGLWDPEYEGARSHWLRKTVDLIRCRYFTIKDFSSLGRPYFSEEYPMEERAWRKNLASEPRMSSWLRLLTGKIEPLEHIDKRTSEALVRDTAEEIGVKAGVLINGVRAALTGQTVGPGLFELMEVLGRDSVIARLQRISQRLDSPEGGEHAASETS